jgi:hypothetical protein
LELAQLKKKLEIWFQRGMVGGWNPVHWKGYALLAAGLACIFLAGGTAASLSGHPHSRLVVTLLTTFAVLSGVTTWVVSRRHSRPWHERDEPLAPSRREEEE